ncbi:hypothetical protein [Mucilaginibacter pedocola]|uniref:Uncharacterized protein n=1 Tax=Mucilaginibacter pedocola TaxID=1792845 RepID=A0A1S9PAJ3_9SPHI|nr:hypothetical protein [Mucilaginibacter pedocola]OOQ57982.1 hypothetical protein BC343_09940 [Mucilaginibacter pedocola]
MKFFPYERFNIITPLSPEEVHQRLLEEIKPPTELSFKELFKGKSHHYFRGVAWPTAFEVEPQISGRNSFVPKITGKTEFYLNGSSIYVTMALKTPVLVFMCAWLGMVCFAFITILLAVVKQGGPLTPLVIPLIMFCFGYGMALFGFKSKSGDAREKLVRMFDGNLEVLK